MVHLYQIYEKTETYERGGRMNQLQALENLIITALLQQPTFNERKSGQIESIEFELDKDKMRFLEKYIIRHRLQSHVLISTNDLTHKITLQPSLTIERLIRDWTRNGEIIGIDPSKISSEFFMLWICLFARKTEKNVVIDTNLEENVKNTLKEFFYMYLKTNLLDKGRVFQITPFTNILLKSFQDKRTLEETEEINNLLTDKERSKLKKILGTMEENHAI